jgi:O-antigen/teichoic acid export membrane protein
MPSATKKKILQGSAANLLQMALAFGVSLIVPHFLVHRMQQAEYSAWVLILQISAYVSYLESGVQTAVGKYVAEYHAAGDTQASARVAGSAFSILSIAGAIGIAAIVVLALETPRIFHQVPVNIVAPMRLGILAIGCTSALMLPFTVLQGIFIGLQRYAIPAILTGTGRVASAIAIIALLLLHGTLSELALLIAGFNILTMLAQWYCWKCYASAEVPLPVFLLDRVVARRLLEYCWVLSIWMVGSLFISGLDTAIVGRYDFHKTGFYGVAGSATNFMLLIVGNALGPVMPAISSVQGQRTAGQLGTLLVRVTRYCTLLLMVLAIPLLIAGYPLLRLWLGPVYATGSVHFLAILVVANVVRTIGYPYALAVVATGSQRLATLAPVAEAIINFITSLLLVRTMGAIGVAIGTLVGAFVGLSIHLLVSMRLTMQVIAVDRLQLLLHGILRPALCALPTLLVLPWFHGYSRLPLSPALLAVWAVATLGIAWLSGLTSNERDTVTARARALL